MPVSHIGLTVSHLPASTSFFLSALQPLGYKYIGQNGNEVGFGVDDADFFLCQETAGTPAGAAHIAFSAPSRIAVREFYTAALTAGGRPNGSPAARENDTYFNAAVLDFDGNSVEVVFREGLDCNAIDMDDGRSKVLTWRHNSAGSLVDDDKSIVSGTRSLAQNAMVLARSMPKSVAPSVVSMSPTAPVLQRSATAPVTSALAFTNKSSGDLSTKTLIGTLLGAAAGAAIGYAMCKTEEDSAREEAKAIAAAQARAQRMVETVQTPPPTPPQLAQQPMLQMLPPQQVVYAPSQISVSRQIDQNAYYAASEYNGAARSSPPQYRAIEAPPSPQSYAPSYVSASPSEAARQRAAEYNLPPIPTVQTVYTDASSRARSIAGESTLIKSFVPSEAAHSVYHEGRRSSTGSEVSHRSSKSKAKSTYTSASKRSHRSHHSQLDHHSDRRSSAPSVHSAHLSPEQPTKAPSIISSILGRGTSSHSQVEPLLALPDNVHEHGSDSDSIAPDDSISNAGSHRSRRSHRSSHSSSRHSTTHSTHSSHSKHSKHSSYHTTHSKHSKHRGSSVADGAGQGFVNITIEEASDVSTVKPAKVSSGTVVSLPVRAITQSMIDGQTSGKRSVVSYAGR